MIPALPEVYITPEYNVFHMSHRFSQVSTFCATEWSACFSRVSNQSDPRSYVPGIIYQVRKNAAGLDYALLTSDKKKHTVPPHPLHFVYKYDRPL